MLWNQFGNTHDNSVIPDQTYDDIGKNASLSRKGADFMAAT